MPVGTGSLFVTCQESPDKLVKENRCLNLAEREECLVVQYLASGGGPMAGGRIPEKIFSGVHSGGGQLVFGPNCRSKADLTLFFPSSSVDTQPSELHFHNYHGYHWHYMGHTDDCPSKTYYEKFEWKKSSLDLDTFREAYAEAMSEVNPSKLIFKYTVSTSCDYLHGKPVTSDSAAGGTGKSYESLLELMDAEKDIFNFYLPTKEFAWSKKNLVDKIVDGSVHGFVTLIGGNETNVEDSEAANNFGFCVQNYAPRADEISPYTKSQIKEYMGLSEGDDDNNDADIDKYIDGQLDRTLNSGTFHSEETISTSYLSWLIKERGFENFEITHFVRYKFDDHAREFVEPILQKRHEVKVAGGSVPHAEALKLIANSDYGYQGLEASKYDDCRLITATNLRRHRKKQMLHLSLKHITLLGIVRIKKKSKKKKQQQKKNKRQRRHCEFALDEADCSDDDDDDDDSDIDDNPFVSHANRGLSESEYETDSDGGGGGVQEEEPADLNELVLNHNNNSSTSSDDDDDDDDDDDVEIRDINHDHSYSSFKAGSRTRTTLKRLKADHSYAKKSKVKYEYDFLYSVVSSGSHKAIKNCLPKAVAILSNSKVIFLSHIHTMLKCLDPRKAEICYTDTDSCIFSTTHENLEDNLLPEKEAEWREAAILADEKGPTSCHGKMKLEGVFKAGLFKALKIYRLFNNVNFEEEFEAKTCYTRCKGVNRNIAKKVPNEVFNRQFLGQVVIHRSCLRPSRTGEMLIAHEAKSLASPFNLKRFVTSDGLHTFPISFADGTSGDPL